MLNQFWFLIFRETYQNVSLNIALKNPINRKYSESKQGNYFKLKEAQEKIPKFYRVVFIKTFGNSVGKIVGAAPRR